MREIVIDTETTDFDPLNGHRIVEIGAVELINRSPTSQTFHRYVCPQRAMPADAVRGARAYCRVLGRQAAVCGDCRRVAFVGDAPLVAHNAGFDIALLNAELKRAAKPPIATERVVDTLVLARRQHAGGLTLDDLCARYGVDRSRRTQHGALLDAELVAAVYVELISDRQAAPQLEPIKEAQLRIHALVRARPNPLPPRVTADDRNAHRAFVATLGGDAIWLYPKRDRLPRLMVVAQRSLV